MRLEEMYIVHLDQTFWLDALGNEYGFYNYILPNGEYIQDSTDGFPVLINKERLSEQATINFIKDFAYYLNTKNKVKLRNLNRKVYKTMRKLSKKFRIRDTDNTNFFSRSKQWQRQKT